MSNTPQTTEKQADHSIDTATGQEALLRFLLLA